jgi:hypothetical protein
MRLQKTDNLQYGSFRGNSITEYALIALLVVILCIGAMQIVGGAFNSVLAKAKGDMTSHKQSAMLASVKTGAGSTMTQSQLAQLQMSLSDKVQTAGANGSTEILASQIDSTAALLLSQGKIDQAQYDILMKLANQGHQVAQIQSMISDALRLSNGSYDQFANTKFDWNGQSYTAIELTKLIGFNGPTPEYFGNHDILASGASAEPAMATFLNLYKQAASSGALTDPAAKSTIDSASAQIAGLGEVTENVMQGLAGGEYSTADQVMKTKEAAMTTTMDARKVCTTGDFQDNGVLCTP